VWIFFLFALGAFVFVAPEFSRKNHFASENSERNYHVVVVGESDSYVFLNQVFQGAESLAKKYNALVELKVPRSEAENLSLEALIDYASFVNADGIIAAVNSESPALKKVFRIDGTEIPIITLGHYSQKNSQVSFIGYNYSALGNRIASESISLFNADGTAYILPDENSSVSNSANVLNSILDFYRQKGISNFQVIGKSAEENESQIHEIMSKKSAEKNSVVICLTEAESMRVLQIASSHENFSFNILGFGENEILSTYLEKGILTKLISPDLQKIGSAAMTELFEYRNKGYANNYINAELKVQEAKNEID
jgi:ribose transport system substrate-binding protein